jgi:5'-3' exonuclease
MGIPSYYKKLADTTKGLITRSCDGKPAALYFDFNCMIYHCARRANTTLPPYPGYDGKDQWEALLLEDIVKYIVKVWQDVGQPKEVFLAVDGVVPMAKIKQQRMRRFKSIWMANEEKKEGTRDNSETWDTNCITPGTSFMKHLSLRLQSLCNKHAQWSLSGAEEPGEGEHKIMMKLRERPASDEPILIYGLDADLILLTLLNSKSPAYLVREVSEMGIVQVNSFGEEEFSFFSLDVLKKTLPLSVSIPNYVAAMSLLGNDFLPHSLTVKIREDGHALLCKTLEQWPNFLVEEEGLLRINHDALYEIVKTWSIDENRRMLTTFKKKIQRKGHVQQTLDTKPIEWMVEEKVVGRGEQWALLPGWKTTYYKEWMLCQSQHDIHRTCHEYVYGLQWVIDYYTGQRAVNPLWYYSRLLPPLWCDIVKYLEQNEYEELVSKSSEPIHPHEQLAMVLPLQSWHLIEDDSLRCLPSILPQFWPEGFEFFSAGRIHMWECEPLLPVLPVERIRAAVKPKRECIASK